MYSFSTSVPRGVAANLRRQPRGQQPWGNVTILFHKNSCQGAIPRREARERVVDGRGHSGGRWRRERMSPQREPREAIPAAREGPERERVAWQRAEERTQWERLERWRGKELGERERRSKRSWSELYGRQERQREQLAKDCRGVLGRLRAWRELGGPHGSAGALSGGVGASATLGAGFVGESAFGSGAGDRKQGGRSLPQLDGRGRGTGA